MYYSREVVCKVCYYLEEKRNSCPFYYMFYVWTDHKIKVRVLKGPSNIHSLIP